MTDYSKLPSLFAPQVTATVGGRDIATGARVERRPTTTQEVTTMSDDTRQPNAADSYLFGQISILQQQIAKLEAERDALRGASAKPAEPPPAEQPAAQPPAAAAPASGFLTGQPTAPPLGVPSSEAMTAFARALTHGRAGYADALQKAGLDPANPLGARSAGAAPSAATPNGGPPFDLTTKEGCTAYARWRMGGGR